MRSTWRSIDALALVSCGAIAVMVYSNTVVASAFAGAGWWNDALVFGLPVIWVVSMIITGIIVRPK
jgi:hypothetical protein